MNDRENGRGLLEARIDDVIEKSERGTVAHLPFLTPRECRQAERLLRGKGLWERAWLWGGYPQAERACFFFLPEYLVAMLPTLPSKCDDSELVAILEDELDEAVCAVRIQGSGYRTLMHRDYLGSILGLGLERDALGDIAVQNEREAVVFCPRTVASFLCENLTKVANDTVKCKSWIFDDSFTDGRRYQPISDTVASPRLDCVVAALTNLSRDEAQTAVRTGLVEVDFEPTERVDLTLTPPVTISVRGYGRFILRSFDGETRKGRLRMRADKLI